MVEVSDIVDEESLEAWLQDQPEEQRYEIGVTLATRAALRVVPIWFAAMQQEWARSQQFTAMSLTHSLLVAGVAGHTQAPDVIKAAKSSSAAAYNVGFNAEATSAAATVAFSAASCSEVRSIRISLSSSSDAAASFYVESGYDIELTDGTVLSDETVLSDDTILSDNTILPVAEVHWFYLRADINVLKLGVLAQQPLWHGVGMPFEVKQVWEEGGGWMQSNPGHCFWIRWYEAALDGRPLTGSWDSHWQMLRDVALIQNEDWEQGAEHVAGLIAEIEKPYALAMTASNERVVISEQTGLLKLEAVVPLVQDFGRYIRRKLGKALEVFGEHPGNQHTAVLPELRLVCDAIEDAENLPVELYDTCTSVTTRVAARIKDGALPAEDKDALIADFLKHIREAGAEIFAEDEETRKAVARRRAIEPNDALIEHGDAIWAVANKISEVSESGPLEQLPQAANQALDPSVSSEGRHTSSFKLVGRIIAVLTTVGAAGLAFPPAVQGAIESYRWLVADPQVQIVWQAILRYLGLA
ncbi:hypothetical protein A9Q94_16895 [Rhodobacterales bacterium 56_14_T64]|nr:hypothetical protein A9Q94_16895 [Rhodobacterales bacterium 56_14_T64]